MAVNLRTFSKLVFYVLLFYSLLITFEFTKLASASKVESYFIYNK